MNTRVKRGNRSAPHGDRPRRTCLTRRQEEGPGCGGSCPTRGQASLIAASHGDRHEGGGGVGHAMCTRVQGEGPDTRCAHAYIGRCWVVLLGRHARDGLVWEGDGVLLVPAGARNAGRVVDPTCVNRAPSSCVKFFCLRNSVCLRNSDVPPSCGAGLVSLSRARRLPRSPDACLHCPVHVPDPLRGRLRAGEVDPAVPLRPRRPGVHGARGQDADGAAAVLLTTKSAG